MPLLYLVASHFSPPARVIDEAMDATSGANKENDYFHTNPPPSSLEPYKKLVKAFIAYHYQSNRNVALVTSGGTTVPLENQTVRFIDNFSAGTRGATSAEYFLENGYAVIFLHRQFSLLPYSRHYSHSTNCFLDFMTEGSNGEVMVSPMYQDKMLDVLQKYNAVRRGNRLLILSFTTIAEYLWELREIAKLTRPLGPKALFYLAAAVSDFFLPRDQISEHKIQSSEDSKPGTNGALTSGTQNSLGSGQGKHLMIDLEPVPKFLKSLVDGWAPEGMIVSFKLETDLSLLVLKSQQALKRYSHHLVIGNLLSTRKFEVVFVTPNAEEKWIKVPLHRRTISLSNPSIVPQKPVIDTFEYGSDSQEQDIISRDLEIEIESLMVPEVIKMHRNFTLDSQQHEEEDEQELLAKALQWAEFGSAE